ncbi:hypothetical protein WMF27_25800 [Sorangium sp. So ce281]|uniref:hypothetical protein n=1 Tax=unclassified Sorangium TaxID=2621164 RepID=UPI003F614304
MTTLVQPPMALAALSFSLTLLLAGSVLAQAPAPSPPPTTAPQAAPLPSPTAAPQAAPLPSPSAAPQGGPPPPPADAPTPAPIPPPDREAGVASPVSPAPYAPTAGPSPGAAPAGGGPPMTGVAPPIAAPVYNALPVAYPAYGDLAVREPADGAPPTANGFQMAIRLGYAIPKGGATGASSDDLSRMFGGQAPILVELGGKASADLFIGVYAGLGLGTPGSAIEAQCSSGLISCSARTFRMGPEMQVHLNPDGKVNPWLGYGAGLEIATLSMSGSGRDASLSLVGLEFAHLMAGVDFRINSAFGMGPVLAMSLGEYSSMTFELDGVEVPDASGRIPETALHAWLSLGVRLVLLP